MCFRRLRGLRGRRGPPGLEPGHDALTVDGRSWRLTGDPPWPGEPSDRRQGGWVDLFDPSATEGTPRCVAPPPCSPPPPSSGWPPRSTHRPSRPRPRPRSPSSRPRPRPAARPTTPLDQQRRGYLYRDRSAAEQGRHRHLRVLEPRPHRADHPGHLQPPEGRRRHRVRPVRPHRDRRVPLHPLRRADPGRSGRPDHRVRGRGRRPVVSGRIVRGPGLLPFPRIRSYRCPSVDGPLA